MAQERHFPGQNCFSEEEQVKIDEALEVGHATVSAGIGYYRQGIQDFEAERGFVDWQGKAEALRDAVELPLRNGRRIVAVATMKALQREYRDDQISAVVERLMQERPDIDHVPELVMMTLEQNP